jgi:predicted DNA-binding transcriptional regulator AlpA
MLNSIAREVKPSRLIRLKRVCELTASSPASVWRIHKYDLTFPQSFKLSEGITCWDESEVLAWIEAKKAARVAR